MRFFSKIVCICNICFIAAALMRIIEFGRVKAGNPEALIPLPPLEGTIAVLGLVVAVILNYFFLCCCIYWLATKKIRLVPRLVTIFNVLIFPIQIIYFFFSPNS